MPYCLFSIHGAKIHNFYLLISFAAFILSMTTM